MSARTTHLVRGGGQFPTEPHPWHEVDRVTQTGVFVTSCGTHIEEPKNESETGEPVPNLSGKTVCYDCARTDTQRADR